MRLPPYPVAGQPLRQSWGRAIIDWMRANTLCPGVGYRVNRSANGTTLAVAGAVAGAAERPFGGKMRVHGHTCTGLMSDPELPYIMVDHFGGTATQVAGPVPADHEPNVCYYAKADLTGWDTYVVP